MKLKLGDGLTIPIEVAGQAVALVGIRGSGKTNTAGVIAEELLDRGQPIVVLDPTDAWWGLRSDYPVFIFGGPHGDLPLNETDGKTLAEFVVQEKVPIILSLRHLRKGAQRRLVMEFCEELYHLKGKPEYREPLTVFIDEAPQFVPQRVMGEMARLVGAVQDMILLGRNAGFGVVLISQRFATLNADVRTQADTVIVHRLPSPLDRKALTEWIEENATIQEQKDVLSSLAKLATGEAWIWSPFFSLFKRAQVRPRHTFDSSAAPTRGSVARPPKDLKAVDLEKLKGKLAATIEKAKGDDPRELRKQIAEQEKQLEILQASQNLTGQSKVKAESLVLTAADRVLLAKFGEQLQALAISLNTDVEEIVERVRVKVASAVNTATGDMLSLLRRGDEEADERLRQIGINRVLDKLASAQAPSATRQPADTRAVSPSRSSAATRPTETRAPRVSDGSGLAGDASIGKCERAILTVLANQPDGAEAGRLTLLTRYRYSGGFKNSLTTLRIVGYIVGENTATLRITDAGRAAIGPVKPLPSGDELARYWLEHPSFGKCERAILDQLLQHPKGRTAEQLCEATNYQYSGGFKNSLTTLRTAGVLVGKNTEVMRASEELF